MRNTKYLFDIDDINSELASKSSFRNILQTVLHI